MPSAPKRKLTEEEDLTIERAATERSIFYRGEIYAKVEFDTDSEAPIDLNVIEEKAMYLS